MCKISSHFSFHILRGGMWECGCTDILFLMFSSDYGDGAKYGRAVCPYKTNYGNSYGE